MYRAVSCLVGCLTGLAIAGLVIPAVGAQEPKRVLVVAIAHDGLAETNARLEQLLLEFAAESHGQFVVELLSDHPRYPSHSDRPVRVKVAGLPGSVPDLTSEQVRALRAISGRLVPLVAERDAALKSVVEQVVLHEQEPSDRNLAEERLGSAELALVVAIGSELKRLQSSIERLTEEQLFALTRPSPESGPIAANVAQGALAPIFPGLGAARGVGPGGFPGSFPGSGSRSSAPGMRLGPGAAARNAAPATD